MDYPVLTYAEAAPVIFLTGVVVSGVLMIFVFMLVMLIEEVRIYFRNKNEKQCKPENKGD